MSSCGGVCESFIITCIVLSGLIVIYFTYLITQIITTYKFTNKYERENKICYKEEKKSYNELVTENRVLKQKIRLI